MKINELELILTHPLIKCDFSSGVNFSRLSDLKHNALKLELFEYTQITHVQLSFYVLLYKTRRIFIFADCSKDK